MASRSWIIKEKGVSQFLQKEQSHADTLILTLLTSRTVRLCVFVKTLFVEISHIRNKKPIISMNLFHGLDIPLKVI